MFDYLKCEVRLPDGYVPDGDDAMFQTKSFEGGSLEHYAITADGRLVRTNERIEAEAVELPFHGDLEFHGADKRQYTARFTDGRLVWIRVGDLVCRG